MRDGTNPCDHGRHGEVRGRRQREALYTHQLGAVGRLAALAAAVGHTQATTLVL